MYGTELDRTQRAVGPLDELAAAEIYGRYMLGAVTDHTLELDRLGRERVFNLGYYTWVEQQGVSLDDFDARRDQSFCCLLYTSPSPRDGLLSRMPSSA